MQMTSEVYQRTLKNGFAQTRLGIRRGKSYGLLFGRPINTCADYLCLQSSSPQPKQKIRFSTSEKATVTVHSMVQTRPMTTLAWTLTSLVCYVSVAMTSALPSPPPGHSLRGVRRSTVTAGAEEQASTSARTPTDLGSLLVCPRGHFFSEVATACKTCSACPLNQIIRRPCSPLADTLCGPFVEFDKFHQSPNAAAAAEQNDSRSDREEQSETGSRVIAGRPDHKQASGRDPVDSREVDQRLVELSLKKASDQWRTLSFALISVLSFICCIVVVVGLYVCILLRRSQAQKVIIRQPDFMVPHPYQDPEPRYVETFVTSRDRIRTSRQLPFYQQILIGDYDTLVCPPLTSSSASYDVKPEEVVRQADGGEHLCMYVNTALLDAMDS